ncbi:hypothetical protein FSP39_020001 [Pinctada imbricata]|uniref:Nucleolar complex protein 2 homolog n=1 Tax=Pinctada imbricata TaxID=66713 RepID=A0AA89C1R3_PINIB|nr:hypothetical protein FSP39_020001 [Pinctada imbricata]
MTITNVLKEANPQRQKIIQKFRRQKNKAPKQVALDLVSRAVVQQLAELSVEEFMTSGLNTDSEDASRSSEDFPKTMKKVDKPEKTDKTSKKKTSKHKQSLNKLKDQDPEFYQFLKNEDAKLLEFSDSEEGDDESEVSDVQSDDDDDSLDDSVDDGEDDKNKTSRKRKADALKELDDIPSSDEDDDEGIYHKMPKELEVASNSEDEDSDDVEEDSEDDKKKKKSKQKKKKAGTLVTMSHIKSWSKELQTKPTVGLVKDVISAFKAAVQKAGSEGEVIKYRVEGNSVFNGIIRMCLSHMAPCLYKIMGLPALTDLQKPTLPTKQNKKWRELRVEVKMYATDLLQLLGELSEASMLNVILKHIHRLIAFYACFPKLSKTMMKKMITLWSVGEETTRIVAFLCINRLVLVTQNTLLEPCMKQMYMAYVKNTKFTSPSTLPLINFMQHSLVEIFAVDFTLTYQFAFIYIRQLAIHLRNAITVKKKENCQAVYNWQYIHCLELWVRLLSAIYPNEALDPLIYPLTQTIIGTIKLLPTAKYYPLRFHCVRCLNTLSVTTSTFVPVLPFLLETLVGLSNDYVFFNTVMTPSLKTTVASTHAH